MTELLPLSGARQPRMTETALELAADLTAEEWAEIGHSLGRANRASGWWIGDWINYGEDAGYVSRESYSTAEAVTGLSRSTLWEYALVARRFESLERSKDLTFTHHSRIARVADREERKTLLSAAEEGRWSTREIDRQITPVPTRQNVTSGKRHSALIDTVETLVRLGERWEREMTDELTPPQAKKQLAAISKAQELLGEVAEAVEYRSATLHSYNV